MKELKKYDLKTKHGLELEVVSLESLTQNSIDQISIPHRVGFHQVYFFGKDSNGFVEINFEKIPIQEHALLFVPDNVICNFYVDSNYTGSVIIFSTLFTQLNGRGADKILKSPLFRRFIPPKLTLADTPRIDALIDEMKAEMEMDITKNKHGLLLNYLESLVLISERSLNVPIQTVQQTTFQRIVTNYYDLLNTYFSTQKQVSFYCDQLNISLHELNQATAALTGYTAKKIIQQKILLEAQALLAYSDFSIKEICFQLGINEPSYFTLLFKNNLQITPSAFRETYRR